MNQKIKEYLPLTLISAAMAICVLFYGGLYWQHSVIPMLLLIVCIVIRRKVNIEMNLCLAVLTVLMLVSLAFTRGDFQNGLYETEKLMLFVLACLAGMRIKEHKSVSMLIFFTALAIAVCGTAAYCGLIRADEFTFEDGGLLRLQSFIRYANAAACFLGCGYLAFLRLYRQMPRKILLSGGAVILTAMWLTFSKACIPLFLLAGTFVIYKNRECRRVFILQNIVTMVFAVPAAVLARNYMYIPALLTVCCCVAASVFLAQKVKKDCFIAWLIFLGACAVGGAVLIIARPEIFSSFYVRLEYARDALKLLKSNPLFGCGSASWRVLQYGVQSSMYHVTYMHNGILQFAVENGLIFAGVFCFLIFRTVYIHAKNKSFELLACVALIFAHSLIDFDLSLTSVLILLGVTAGSAFSVCGGHKSKLCNIAAKLLLVFITVCAAALSAYMLCEYFVRSSFETEYVDGDKAEALRKAELLERVCPRDSYHKVNLAALWEQNGGERADITAYLERASELSPGDPVIYEYYMRYVISDKNAEKMCLHYIKLAPKQENTYSFLKNLLTDLHKRNIIYKEKYDYLTNLISGCRKKHGVIDRNELLEELAEKNN